jgi:hypothetical protein
VIVPSTFVEATVFIEVVLVSESEVFGVTTTVEIGWTLSERDDEGSGTSSVVYESKAEDSITELIIADEFPIDEVDADIVLDESSVTAIKEEESRLSEANTDTGVAADVAPRDGDISVIPSEVDERGLEDDVRDVVMIDEPRVDETCVFEESRSIPIVKVWSWLDENITDADVAADGSPRDEEGSIIPNEIDESRLDEDIIDVVLVDKSPVDKVCIFKESIVIPSIEEDSRLFEGDIDEDMTGDETPGDEESSVIPSEVGESKLDESIADVVTVDESPGDKACVNEEFCVIPLAVGRSKLGEDMTDVVLLNEPSIDELWELEESSVMPTVEEANGLVGDRADEVMLIEEAPVERLCVLDESRLGDSTDVAVIWDEENSVSTIAVDDGKLNEDDVIDSFVIVDEPPIGEVCVLEEEKIELTDEKLVVVLTPPIFVEVVVPKSDNDVLGEIVAKWNQLSVQGLGGCMYKMILLRLSWRLQS